MRSNWPFPLSCFAAVILEYGKEASLPKIIFEAIKCEGATVERDAAEKTKENILRFRDNSKISTQLSS